MECVESARDACRTMRCWTGLYMSMYVCMCDCKIKTWKIRIGKKACVKLGSVGFIFHTFFVGLFAFFEFTFRSEFNPCVHSEQR